MVPEFLITGYKDFKLWQSKPSHWPIEEKRWVDGKEVMMVWQRHDLFSGPGRRLADRLHAPLVTSVEATVVWEARKWGVSRPIWGNLLERYSEAKALRQSDLVICVSDEVREQVIKLGVSADRSMVCPNRVDSTVFHPGVKGVSVREKFNLQGKRVVGWTGSFRNFHGLDSLLGAFHKVHQKHPDTILMLVGDGQEFDRVRQDAQRLGIGEAVIFPGRQLFTAIPAFIANFEVALVSARSAEGFHYSPLKLREYLACGKAVIAPLAGDLPKLFEDEVDLLFYKAGNEDSLAEQMLRILESSHLRESLRTRSTEYFNQEGTWLHELNGICQRLSIQ